MLDIFRKYSSLISGNILQALLIGFITCCCILSVQYHWKRRRLYRMAKQRPGPLSLPFIGSGYYFIGPNNDILKSLKSITANFESPVPFWLGNKLLFVITEPKDFETLMNSPHALQKEELYKYAKPFSGEGLFTAPVPKWKKHRKIITPAFNQMNLDQFVEVFCEKTEILLKQLEKEICKGPFDIFGYISRCNIDIICETGFGIAIDAQTMDAPIHNWLDRCMDIIYKRMFNIFYQSDILFNLSPLSKEFDTFKNNLYKFLDDVVETTREAHQRKMDMRKSEYFVDEDTTKRKNFLQQLLELSEDGKQFTNEDLRDEIMTFIVAGSDTSATINSFIFMVLGMFPDIQDKVYEEIIDVLGPDRSVEPKDIKHFKYMEMVFKESMRVFPLAPIIARYVSKDIKLDKLTIPEGSSLALFLFDVHRNPKIWPDPLKFDPNRFLPEEVAKRHPYSWLPFSGGPRNCIGIRYAYMAMKTLTATVIRKYKFSTEYKNIGDVELKSSLLLRPADGFTVSIQLRE